ncbi:hypothetical protein F5146DRAFT_1127076 [Armillaria mellea]|nr:hypothetical protein F5146DRAFT_1127076 [Armillaria mellea]
MVWGLTFRFSFRRHGTLGSRGRRTAPISEWIAQGGGSIPKFPGIAVYQLSETDWDTESFHLLDEETKTRNRIILFGSFDPPVLKNLGLQSCHDFLTTSLASTSVSSLQVLRFIPTRTSSVSLHSAFQSASPLRLSGYIAGNHCDGTLYNKDEYQTLNGQETGTVEYGYRGTPRVTEKQALDLRAGREDCTHQDGRTSSLSLRGSSESSVGCPFLRKRVGVI